MKYKGIIRRLDSLGRVVIPREYRKLHKIKESDPLEIISLETGEIVVRKVDVSSQLCGLGSSFIDEIASRCNCNVALCDMENYLYVAGEQLDICKGSILPTKIASQIMQRKKICVKCEELAISGDKYVFVSPIFKQDAFGAIVIFSSEPIAQEIMLLSDALSNILAGNMQSY